MNTEGSKLFRELAANAERSRVAAANFSTDNPELNKGEQATASLLAYHLRQAFNLAKSLAGPEPDKP